MAVKVAVIGVGYLGQHHARIYSGMGDAELVAVVDIDKEKADTLAAQYSAKAFYDFRDALDRVEAVSIVTPTPSHYEIALECLKAGKDVLIEKPITVTIEEADALIREAAKTGRIIQVGHLERFNPAILAAAELINDPVFIESERLSPFLVRATDIDVTLDLMIHDIDIILSLVALPVRDIRAVGASILSGKIDVAKAWLEFENGCMALATVSRLSPEKQRRLKIFQKDSYLSVDYQSSEMKRYYKTPEGIAVDSAQPEKKEPLKEELKDFIRCVQERKPPKVSAVEGRDALRVVLEINRMIRNTESG